MSQSRPVPQSKHSAHPPSKHRCAPGKHPARLCIDALPFPKRRACPTLSGTACTKHPPGRPMPQSPGKPYIDLMRGGAPWLRFYLLPGYVEVLSFINVHLKVGRSKAEILFIAITATRPAPESRLKNHPDRGWASSGWAGCCHGGGTSSGPGAAPRPPLA